MFGVVFTETKKSGPVQGTWVVSDRKTWWGYGLFYVSNQGVSSASKPEANGGGGVGFPHVLLSFILSCVAHRLEWTHGS